MSVLSELTEDIIAGKRLDRADDVSVLISADINELCAGADRIREKLCGKHVDLCSIINGKSGRCGENCRFCAQSAHNHTGAEEYPFLDSGAILAECRHNCERGVHRFSIVTAGRRLEGEDFEKALEAYSRMRREIPEMKLCASHGLLTDEQLRQLRESGVTRYHCNIETSRRNFPNICTSHTFNDKIDCIKRAKRAGLEVCSGGIIGMGETWEDRLDMAFTLAELDIRSVPVNVLRPIKGTPLEGLPLLPEEEILRTGTVFRYILPEAYVRFAAGRNMLSDGELAFRSGFNSAITGDMLTTSGNRIAEDVAMLTGMGLDVSREQPD